MLAGRAASHASLPAPSLHAGYSASQSKSHVLAGVQDAYWSDDEAEDAECPLCLEEMDVSDLNFKPCMCGYQICRFCWHHIKENLNGRCPACRREYTEEGVQFKAVNPEDHKRLMNAKKQRERERKELETLGRKHLANVRVVQRNVAYVTGLGPRFAKEELIPTLRSNDYFGQYGKISKITIKKSTPPGSTTPVVGLYITYHRREDATRCIAVVDGAPPPGGGTEVMRASYGTTKYCMAFLRGVTCNDHSCMNLHEWGDEKDCFTKEDLTTLKHSIKDSETRTKAGGKAEPEGALPRGASWASQKTAAVPVPAASSTSRRSGRAAASSRQSRSSANSTSTAATAVPSRASTRDEKKATAAAAKAASAAVISRPSTPTAQAAAANTEAKPARRKETVPEPVPASPSPSASAPSEPGSMPKSPIIAPPEPIKAESPVMVASPVVTSALPPGLPAAPPGLPAAPPGLPAAPPGLPAAPPGLAAVPPGLPPVPPGLPVPHARTDTTSPQIAASSSYTMSNAARALLDDVKARREAPTPVLQPAPFPDLDRTLQLLSADPGESGGFTFSLDPSLMSDAQDDPFGMSEFSDYALESDMPFAGNFMTAFPGLRPTPRTTPNHGGFPVVPPGLAYNNAPSRAIYDPLGSRPPLPERQSTTGSNYSGAFNPFGDSADAFAGPSSRPASNFGDEDRKTSRFGFARGRQSSATPSIASTSSPMQSMATVDLSNVPTPYHASHQTPPALQPWPTHRQDFGSRSATSRTGSPFAPPQGPGHSAYAPQPSQPRQHIYDNGVSDAQLKEFLRGNQPGSQPRTIDARPNPMQFPSHHQHQQYQDPAIMSASFGAPGLNGGDQGYMGHNMLDRNFQNPAMAYGPPPGLAFRNNVAPSPAMSSVHGGSGLDSAHVSNPTSPIISSSIPLSNPEFPVLPTPSDHHSGTTSPLPIPIEPIEPVEPVGHTTPEPDVEGSAPEPDAAKEKAERKAAKKAAAAERAAERARLAQERAAARAAEKAKVAAEKTEQREREKADKLRKEQEEKERLDQEKADKARERAERDRIEKERVRLEKEAAERVRVEREKERAERERVALAKRTEIKKPAAAPSMSTTQHKQAEPPVAPVSTPSASALAQVPLLSKMPKKQKPATKFIRIPKEGEIVHDTTSTVPSATATDAPPLPSVKGSSSVEAISTLPTDTTAYSSDSSYSERASLEELLDQIDAVQPWMNLLDHPFFDITKINPAAKMPLEYAPLVHALSALSVGGGSFTNNNMPNGSIDNAVSSFQQLLETLTQTISDLLRLLPRTTWDDSSSFDGVLRDMLKGDDFLDDGGEDGNGRDDEVAALTLALERRARWMEVQLSKLEELHRDINTAAVRAVLSFNDRGWDKHAFMPRMSNTLARFDNLSIVQLDDGSTRPMTADELEQKLIVANEAAVFAETELRESMEKMQGLRMAEEDF